MPMSRFLFPLLAAALAAACASPQAPAGAAADPHAAHRATPVAAAPAAGVEPRMQAMQEMHDKMRAAKTPAERQALMADHMKAMRDGMAMMKDMGRMGRMGGMGGMGGAAGTAGGKGMADGMAKHHQMMAEHNAAMHLMMDMMLDQLPAGAPAK